jgi:hypothetical protein
MDQTFTTTTKKNNLIKYILLTGLLAGTLDATTAMAVYNSGPDAMFRYIASGAFGREAAFTGGSVMVVWGVLFHYFIALTWTTLYFLIYPFVQRLASYKYLAAIVYGIFVWVIMNRVVLPLTKIPQGDFYWDRALVGATILVFMIGLPVSFFAHRYYSRQ